MSNEPDREWQIQVYVDGPTRKRLGLIKAYLELTMPELGQISWSQAITWLTCAVPVGQLFTEALAQIDATIGEKSDERESEPDREPEPGTSADDDKPAKRGRRNATTD